MLVTGGAGFVGATLVRRLVASGYEAGRNFASYDLARRLLGYSPAVRIEDGIPLLWQWFTSQAFRD